MSDLGNLFGREGGAATFLGLPACAGPDEVSADVAVIGAPIATPYRALGTYAAGSPGALRRAMATYAGSLGHHDFDLGGPVLPSPATAVDCGDLAGDAGDAPGNRDRIRSAVGTILGRGAVPVVLGGDDSVPIPVLQAYEGRGPLTVVQIDAHIDWRDEVDGERYGLSSPMRRASEMPWVERIVQVGARALGSARPGDVEDARAWGASLVTAREVRAGGIEPILDLVPEGAEIFFTVDVDGLDPGIMPAGIGPAPGGLDYTQVVDLMHGCAAKGRLAGFDIVEFMPERDPQGLAALTAARLVVNAIGLAARAKG